MKTDSLIQIPGYNYNEYLLVLNPHQDLCDKIMQVKKEFSEKYRVAVALYSKTTITLVNFIQFEMVEERLVNRLHSIAAGYKPFRVDLKDYGSFPSHTIFINIESKQQVQNLGKALRPAQQLMTLDKENKPHFINDPFFTVARKLLPWQYEKAWLDYSHRYFTGCFMADGMLLLKRELRSDGDRQTGKYQTVKRFEFMNLPVNATQGELFR
ncbi:MAG: 2'-5' RNA ligase family protein [Ginsengibacter sp.]